MLLSQYFNNLIVTTIVIIIVVILFIFLIKNTNASTAIAMYRSFLITEFYQIFCNQILLYKYSLNSIKLQYHLLIWRVENRCL